MNAFDGARSSPPFSSAHSGICQSTNFFQGSTNFFFQLMNFFQDCMNHFPFRFPAIPDTVPARHWSQDRRTTVESTGGFTLRKRYSAFSPLSHRFYLGNKLSKNTLSDNVVSDNPN